MGTPAKILVIDDEPPLREVLKAILSERYDVIVAASGHEGLRLAREHRPAAILLDVLMSQMDGLATCESLQRDPELRDIPVMMLTAVSNVNERIRAFRIGAADYIEKPFYPDELLVRIEAKIRRVGQETSPSRDAVMPELVRCGNLTLDPQNLEVRVDGESVSLTLLEQKLLRFMVENKGLLKRREEILEAVWKSRTIPGKILEPHVLALRRKLSRFDHRLATVYGSGYVLKPREREVEVESVTEFGPESASADGR